MNNPAQTWLGISEQDLFQGILQRGASNEKTAKSLCEKIQRLDPTLRDDFAAYWNTDQIACNVERHGYTVSSLINEMKMKPMGAFVTLDWLIKDPDAALQALQRGYDRVIISNDKRA